MLFRSVATDRARTALHRTAVGMTSVAQLPGHRFFILPARYANCSAPVLHASRTRPGAASCVILRVGLVCGCTTNGRNVPFHSLFFVWWLGAAVFLHTHAQRVAKLRAGTWGRDSCTQLRWLVLDVHARRWFLYRTGALHCGTFSGCRRLYRACVPRTNAHTC